MTHFVIVQQIQRTHVWTRLDDIGRLIKHGDRPFGTHDAAVEDAIATNEPGGHGPECAWTFLFKKEFDRIHKEPTPIHKDTTPTPIPHWGIS